MRSKGKSTLQDTDIDEQLEKIETENNNKCSIKKKIKINYELEKELEKLITADVANKKYWDDCKDLLDKGKKVCILFNHSYKYINVELVSFAVIICSIGIFGQSRRNISVYMLSRDCFQSNYNRVFT